MSCMRFIRLYISSGVTPHSRATDSTQEAAKIVSHSFLLGVYLYVGVWIVISLPFLILFAKIRFFQGTSKKMHGNLIAMAYFPKISKKIYSFVEKLVFGIFPFLMGNFLLHYRAFSLWHSIILTTFAMKSLIQ